jgi:hypothetical protein
MNVSEIYAEYIKTPQYLCDLSLGKYFEIKITDLNIGSRQLVDVMCDFCKKVVNITYKEYIRNISIGNKYACSKYCGSLKAKETNNPNLLFTRLNSYSKALDKQIWEMIRPIYSKPFSNKNENKIS